MTSEPLWQWEQVSAPPRSAPKNVADPIGRQGKSRKIFWDFVLPRSRPPVTIAGASWIPGDAPGLGNRHRNILNFIAENVTRLRFARMGLYS